MRHLSKLLLTGCLSLATLLGGPPAQAAERGTQREAYALFEKAVQTLEKEKPAQAFNAFNTPKGPFQHKDLYVFVIDLKGNYVANGSAPKLVGTYVLDTQDAAGNPLFRNMIDAVRVEREAKVRYVWLNRKDNAVEPKVTYLHRRGDYILGVGYYAPRSTAESARKLMDRAAELVQQQGMDKAAASFNDPKGSYIKDDLYVFAVNLDSGKFEAMGANPRLTGSDALNLADVEGHALIADMIKLARDKGEGTVSYIWRNPVTNAVEKKHSFIRRVGNSLVGVGYYQE